jgi:ribosomal protein L16 Arg81 hydroxylase
MPPIPFGVDRFLAPVSPAAFLAEYWERTPLLVAREDPDYYRGVFSTADVDAVLAQSRVRYPQLRLASTGRSTPFDPLVGAGWLNPVLPHREFDTKLNHVFDLYADGYTVIVEMEKLWRPATEVVRALEAWLHHKATAELYMTPRGAQGFDLHYDHHDVFITQIEGRKRWQVFAPVVALPVSEGRVSEGQLRHPPLIEDTLEAGDLLYIPRGFPHRGFTSDQFSLHITFGVFVFRWQDLVVHAVKEMTGRDARFRESVPAGFLSAAGGAEGLRERLGELLRALADGHRADAALEQLSVSFLRKLYPIPDGHFEQLNRLPDIGVGSVLEKRAGSVCYVTLKGDEATLHFPGGYLSGPDWLEPALRFVADREQFTASELPVLADDESKLVLARRLVREGLLRVVRL